MAAFRRSSSGHLPPAARAAYTRTPGAPRPGWPGGLAALRNILSCGAAFRDNVPVCFIQRQEIIGTPSAAGPGKAAYGFGMHVACVYDPTTGRLIDLIHTKPDGTFISDFAYTHDAAGNILSTTTDFGLVQYGYDAANQLLAYGAGLHDPVGLTPPTVPAFTFTYDANGSTVSNNDLTAGTSNQYGYNFDNRMNEVRRDGELVARYFYDHPQSPAPSPVLSAHGSSRTPAR